ncbi:MAG: retropepsin-like domain-containing protein [Myxococcales bacterium]|nr:retropepsin-like domain-containing protein [Myxococcales bacterium]
MLTLLLAGCLHAYGPALSPSFADAPVADRPAGTFADALCAADLRAAADLAANDDERGLVEQLATAYVGEPDLAWLQGWLDRHGADEPLSPLVQGLLVSSAGLHGRAAEVTTTVLDEVDRAELDAMAALPPFVAPAITEPVTLPMRLDDLTALPMVEVTVEGKPVWFIIDTGAGITAVNDRVLPRHHPRTVEGLTLSGSAATASYDLATVDLGLGPIALDDAAVAVLHHRELIFRFLGIKLLEIRGILGWPILSRYRVELDYAAGTVTFAPPGDPVDDPNLVWAGTPYVRGAIDGAEALLLLDTGAVGSSLFLSARDRGVTLPEGARSTTTLGGVGGADTFEIERIPGPRTLHLGGASLSAGTLDALPDDPEEPLCGDAWLGSDAFRSARLVVDATAGTVQVLPSDAGSP